MQEGDRWRWTVIGALAALLAVGLARAASAEASPPRRRYLIIAPVGDKSTHDSSWLDDRQHRNFDLLLIYYGANPAFACAECVGVVHNRGPKWKLVSELEATPEWAAVKDDYDAFMVADDDLRMSTQVLNDAFDIFAYYGLLLAQPSLCRLPDVYTSWHIVFQSPDSVLRYTAFIEVMAPMFEAEFFKRVVLLSLKDSFTGWGLDFVWPFVLGYPHDRIAVIDAVCMIHPANQGAKASLYSIQSPYGWDPNDELRYFLRKYNINDATWRAKGCPGHPPEVAFSGVPAQHPPEWHQQRLKRQQAGQAAAERAAAAAAAEKRRRSSRGAALLVGQLAAAAVLVAALALYRRAGQQQAWPAGLGTALRLLQWRWRPRQGKPPGFDEPRAQDPARVDVRRGRHDLHSRLATSPGRQLAEP